MPGTIYFIMPEAYTREMNKPPVGQILSPVIYGIDEEDRIVFIGGAWDAFAVANHAEQIISSRVLHTSLWQHCQGAMVEQMYRSLLQRVRATKRQIEFIYRCDAPEIRRFIRMCIKNLEEQPDLIAFTNQIVREELRPYQALLDVYMPRRSDDMVAMCSWCNKVRVDGSGWHEVEDAIAALKLFERDTYPEITHTICPACVAKVETELS